MLKMKLSEFYTQEKFYYSIDGRSVYRDSIKTPRGELYVDDERDLYYKENRSDSPVFLRGDVGEWIYFNDDKIICSSFYSYSPFYSPNICIVDTCGNHIASGVLNEFGFIYTKNNKVIKETPNQEEYIIFELESNSSPVFFNDTSFTTVYYYPHSDFLYTKFYDYNGNYLEAQTKDHFVQMVLRDLIYGFIKHIPIKDGVLDVTDEQMVKYKLLEKLRFETKSTQVNFDLIDHIIGIIQEMGQVNEYAVKGYQIIKKAFNHHGIKENLILPLLNIMTIERSGDFGRRSYKWISITNAKRIDKIAAKSKHEFKDIIYNIELLWENMKIVSI